MYPPKQHSLRERAAMFTDMIRTPGWELLQRSFRPEIRTRVTDQDAKESFLYEAIRAQVIQEIFSTPHMVIHQAEREWIRQPIDSLNQQTPPETEETL